MVSSSADRVSEASNLGQSDQVVGSPCQSDLNLKDAARRSMGRVTADSLGPTKWLLGSLAFVLADLIARMPCRSNIDRRGPVGRVLRGMRRDVEVAQTLSLHPSFSMLLTSREIPRSIPNRTPGAGVFRSRIVPGAAVARRHGAAMTASSSNASRTCVVLAPAEGPGALAHFESSLPNQGVASRWVLFCTRAGQRAKWREQVLSKLWRRMAGGIRFTRRHANRAQATYRAEVLPNSTLGHCCQRALTVPRTWMTAPSVITPRNVNKLKKAKQLSGTASASNESRFLAKYVCLRLRRPAEF